MKTFFLICFLLGVITSIYIYNQNELLKFCNLCFNFLKVLFTF